MRRAPSPDATVAPARPSRSARAGDTPHPGTIHPDRARARAPAASPCRAKRATKDRSADAVLTTWRVAHPRMGKADSIAESRKRKPTNPMRTVFASARRRAMPRAARRSEDGARRWRRHRARACALLRDRAAIASCLVLGLAHELLQLDLRSSSLRRVRLAVSAALP